jgi:hypothetical protein
MIKPDIILGILSNPHAGEFTDDSLLPSIVEDVTEVQYSSVIPLPPPHSI